MSVILILILASLTLALAFLAGFIWAVRSGQYEDTFTPSLRVLTEEENTTSPPTPALSPSDGARERVPARPATATSSSDQNNRRNLL